MIRSLKIILLMAILVLLLPACATLHDFPPATMEEAGCERFFHEMDQRIAEHDVADAETAHVKGFPELRVDRFLASFTNENLTNEAYGFWVEHLRKLDSVARQIEWRNLPDEAASGVKVPLGPDIGAAVDVCGRILAERDGSSPRRRTGLLTKVEAPDAYSTWQRVFGVYPVSRWAIVEGVRRGQREMREPFMTNREELSVTGNLIRYAPPMSEALGDAEVAKILEQSAANPLSIPEPSEQQLTRLFTAFAPVWAVDTATDSDRIGIARIGEDEKAYIDTQEPIVYRLASHTRFGKQVLLQLNYIIWFPARPPVGPIDIYAGRFDGLIWRVTLRMDGKPLAYDSIHTCGCYYQIFPGEGVRVVQPQDGSEPILSPKSIPSLKPGERLMVSLASRTHFIQGITLEGPEPGAMMYRWLGYDELRSLPMPDGRHRSLFDTDGLIPGSERSERFLLWPMGVPSAGAMRQWGTHAIAFLGKRHFDEPRLLEKLLRPLWE